MQAEKTKSPAKGAGLEQSREYFTKLKLLLKVGLLVAFLTPLSILSVYFHFQFNVSLKESGKLHLAALAQSQRNTVDLFLQERVLNIFSVFQSSEFNLAPSELDMQHYLQNLRQASDAFIDVGFFDQEGVQIGYAGPYPYLHGRDYSDEDWFRSLIDLERNYYISDIYLGFRNKPHFTIAVKQLIDGKYYVVRATLDPDKFYLFLRGISRGKGVDSALVNSEGKYQVVDPDRGQLFGPSDYAPTEAKESGVKEIEINGSSVLVSYYRLSEVPWTLVVREPLRVAYAEMYRTRRIIIIVTGVIILATIAAIWLIVDNLINRAEATEESRAELKYQLIHASKLASVGELAAGVAHEINNPLAIIVSESGVIRDMLDPEFGLDSSPESIRAELDEIDTAVFRARGITQKLLNFARKHEPRLVPCDINKILDNVVGGLKEREFLVSDIELEKNYARDLPLVSLDPDQIAQVFLNLINNAQDAIVGEGKITLSTSLDDGRVYVTVADTGAGMTPEQMGKIFLPFFTTKEVGKGTGLGLSVSLSIVESMGGTIEVQSLPGSGSSFTVVLPAG